MGERTAFGSGFSLVDHLAMSTVRIRLTGMQTFLIAAGLNRVMNGYATYRATGTTPYMYPFRMHPLAPEYNWRTGRFNDRLMRVMQDVWKQMRSRKGKRSRFQFDFVAMSACILAIRIEQDYQRHKGDRKPTKKQKEEAASAIAGLERHLKRARALYVRENGDRLYADARRDWLMHLRWIRSHLTYFRKPWPVLSRRYQREVLHHCYGCAEAGLRKRGKEMPETAEFKHLVQLALRYVRRGRVHGIDVGTLVKLPRYAEIYFSDFILNRHERANEEEEDNEDEE